MTIQRKPVVIDTDIGDDIDDALAIAMALACPEFDVRGITVVHGEVDIRARLLVKLLRLAGRKEIPVGVGEAKPINQEPRRGIVQYQARALDEEEWTARLDCPPALDLLREILAGSDEPVELITIGPLTNIARLLSEYPHCKEGISGITVMGGNFTDPYPEYNVSSDPEAADIVFRSGIPFAVVGVDVTSKCRMSKQDVEELETASHPLLRFLHELIQIWIPLSGGHMPVLHDPLTVASVAHASLLSWQEIPVRVELKDKYHRGVTFTGSGGTKCRVATSHDDDEFRALFMECLFTHSRTMGSAEVKQG